MLFETVKSRVEWLRNLPARMALRWHNRPDIRAALQQRYEVALALHQPKLPRLAPQDELIVETLKRDGIAISTLEALGLPGSDLLLEAAAELAKRFSAEAHRQAAAGKVFLIVPPDHIVSKPRIFNWGLQDRLLDIAETYIGLPPAFDGVAVNFTVADGREVSTRCWHQDWEDRRMLKIAVYLHDVGESGGPFQALRRNDTMQREEDGYIYELADEAELERRLGTSFRDDIVSCTGAKGTVIFVDTARLYHRGKPATEHDRATIFYSYFAQSPRHPYYCERTGMKQRNRLTLAQGLPLRQRQAVTWRSRIPIPLRIIPRATL